MQTPAIATPTRTIIMMGAPGGVVHVYDAATPLRASARRLIIPLTLLSVPVLVGIGIAVVRYPGVDDPLDGGAFVIIAVVVGLLLMLMAVVAMAIDALLPRQALAGHLDDALSHVTRTPDAIIDSRSAEWLDMGLLADECRRGDLSQYSTRTLRYLDYLLDGGGRDREVEIALGAWSRLDAGDDAAVPDFAALDALHDATIDHDALIAHTGIEI